MRGLPPMLLPAVATALLLFRAATAGVVVFSTNILGDALVERLAARRAAR